MNPKTEASPPDDAALESAMRAQAQEHDAGQPDPDMTDEISRDEITHADAPQPGDKTNATKTDQPGEALDSTAATKAAADKQQQQQQQRPESEYTKRTRQLKEDQERLNRNREAFEKEKREARQALENERRALRPAAAPAAEADNPLARYSVQDLEAAADRFERAGKFDLADQAREAAREGREREARGGARRTEAPAAPAAEAPGRLTQEAFVSQWREHLSAEVTSNPDLGKQDSALYKEVSTVLREEPLLSRIPDGIRKAVKLAKLQLEARALPGLKEKVTTLEAELADLRKRVSPGGGGAESRGSGPRAFSDMSEAEQLRFLEQQTLEVDRAQQSA